MKRRAPRTLISDAPKLIVSKRIRRMPEAHEPNCEYRFRYLDKHHSELPHVVKFSGGRSSGMLLLTLLANNILKHETPAARSGPNRDQERGSVPRSPSTCHRPGAEGLSHDEPQVLRTFACAGSSEVQFVDQMSGRGMVCACSREIDVCSCCCWTTA